MPAARGKKAEQSVKTVYKSKSAVKLYSLLPLAGKEVQAVSLLFLWSVP